MSDFYKCIPFLKFDPDKWRSGSIQGLPEYEQATFINTVAFLAKTGGEWTDGIDLLAKEISPPHLKLNREHIAKKTDSIKTLIDCELIKDDGIVLSVDWVSETVSEVEAAREQKKQQCKEAGRKGGYRKAQKNKADPEKVRRNAFEHMIERINKKGDLPNARTIEGIQKDLIHKYTDVCIPGSNRTAVEAGIREACSNWLQRNQFSGSKRTLATPSGSKRTLATPSGSKRTLAPPSVSSVEEEEEEDKTLSGRGGAREGAQREGLPPASAVALAAKSGAVAPEPNQSQGAKE